MNSKWSAKKQQVIEIAFGSEAAARLKFGTSPFVLKAGETTLPEQEKKKKAPPNITPSNLHPDQKGGIDVDDLQSVSGQSHAETVFGKVSEDEEDNEEYADDEVSMMGDDEGFESEDDEKTCVEIDDDEEIDEYEDADDESTKSGWKKMRDEDSESESSPAKGSDDESTKVDLDQLKAKGRKVRDDSVRNDELKKLREDLARQDEMMERMRLEFEEKLREAKASAPGVAEGVGAGVGDSGNGSGGDASAEPG